jgi:hypothetical protein
MGIVLVRWAQIRSMDLEASGYLPSRPEKSGRALLIRGDGCGSRIVWGLPR